MARGVVSARVASSERCKHVLLGLRANGAGARIGGATFPRPTRLRETYLPRLRAVHRSHGRRIETRPCLFPSYLFARIGDSGGWWSARWAPYVAKLIMAGIEPARVTDNVIAEIRGREVGGLIELAPPPSLTPGARVRILRGPFIDHLGLYAGMKPRQRVEILLQLLGGEQRVTLAKKDIEAVR